MEQQLAAHHIYLLEKHYQRLIGSAGPICTFSTKVLIHLRFFHQSNTPQQLRGHSVYKIWVVPGWSSALNVDINTKRNGRLTKYKAEKNSPTCFHKLNNRSVNINEHSNIQALPSTRGIITSKQSKHLAIFKYQVWTCKAVAYLLFYVHDSPVSSADNRPGRPAKCPRTF